MAKIEKILICDFDAALEIIENAVLSGSMSASLEERSDFYDSSSGCRCAVRVFERYSMMGDNRVSLNVTLFSDSDGVVRMSACTSGGSKAVFNKINTIGENAFLSTLNDRLQRAGLYW
ncbi:MAG: DUF6054 family protein [Solobacterium sp.]|nr:DUF6054 family protein [Solobacterium sp.]